MKLETLYRTFRTFKVVTELAYLFGYRIGKGRGKK